MYNNKAATRVTIDNSKAYSAARRFSGGNQVDGSPPATIYGGGWLGLYLGFQKYVTFGYKSEIFAKVVH